MHKARPIAGLGGVDRSALGIPDENSLVTLFCKKTNLTKPNNWEALIAFQCFRFTAILQGVLKRHSEGNASAKNAAEVGGQAKNVATLGYKALKDFLEV